MQVFRKVSPLMWTRGSGKRLRGDPVAQVLALYLVTGVESEPTGLYHVTIGSIAAHTGAPSEDLRRAFGVLHKVGFASYDEDCELVWVPNMLEIQVGAALKPGDKRGTHVRKWLESQPYHPFLAEFYERYGEAYSMPLPRSLQGAPKPHRSMESEKEMERESESETVARGSAPPRARVVSGSESTQAALVLASPSKPAKAQRKPKDPAPTTAVWEAYAFAFEQRYASSPVRNAKINGQLSQLVAQIGAEDAPHVARWYLANGDRWYVTRMHPVGQMVADCQKLRAEWLRGRPVTDGDARAAALGQEMRAQVDRVEEILEGMGVKSR